MLRVNQWLATSVSIKWNTLGGKAGRRVRVGACLKMRRDYQRAKHRTVVTLHGWGGCMRIKKLEVNIDTTTDESTTVNHHTYTTKQEHQPTTCA